MKIYVIFISIYYFNSVSLAFLRSNLLSKHEELRKKINKIFNGKKGDEMFLNIDEYPSTNKTLRQLHKQQWLNYYECVKKTYAGVGHEKITYPNALVALEGTFVTLKCQICISPEMHMDNLIEWYFNSSSKSSVVKSTIENTDHIFHSPNNQYIVMYNLKLQQTGEYWCEIGDTMGSVYYLDIESNFETVDVYPDTAPYAPQAASAENVEEYELKVYTTWTEWSSCSMCDAVGIKIRYGYCTISLLETSAHRYIVNKNALITDKLGYIKREAKIYEWNQMDERTTQTMIINERLKDRLRTILLLFKNKLPCKSKLVPKQIQIIPIIKNRKIEIMRRYCKKKCRKHIIFEVRDEKGNVLESANNSAGIYSMIQGMPEPLPSITHNVVYEKRNQKFKLVCPGNLNANIPIVWQIGDKTIIPSRIGYQSNGRIHINSQMHILFESLKFEDARIYSCWQNNEVVGIIKLNVTEEVEFKLNHHVILIGAIAIISVFLIMFWKSFKRRTRYMMH